MNYSKKENHDTSADEESTDEDNSACPTCGNNNIVGLASGGWICQSCGTSGE